MSEQKERMLRGEVYISYDTELRADAILGGGVIKLPGVTIGSDTVIGAGAVVTKDVPAGIVAAGNPAEVIRRLSAWEHPPEIRVT